MASKEFCVRVLLGFAVLASTYHLVNSIECYTDVEGKTIVTCKELDGFKTCFTKYNDSKYIPSAFPFGVLYNYQVESNIVGRGCSTKDKVFYRECETFSYGDNLEKMCFCSFKLCNAATPTARATAGHTLLLLTTLCSVLLTRYWSCSCTPTASSKLHVHSAKKRGRWREFSNKNSKSVDHELCCKIADSLSSTSRQLLIFEPCTNCETFSCKLPSQQSHLICCCLERNQISVH